MISPSFILTAPLLYTSIFPMKPVGRSFILQAVSEVLFLVGGGLEVSIISLPFLEAARLTKGRECGR